MAREEIRSISIADEETRTAQRAEVEDWSAIEALARSYRAPCLKCGALLDWGPLKWLALCSGCGSVWERERKR